MIAFDLTCSNGHVFECWFKNSESFEEQKAYGVITCPICEDNNIEKALSPVAIRKHGGKKEESTITPTEYQALQKLYDYIDKNFEDVGLDFTREALKMHYGDESKRNIKGKALPNE